MRAYHWSVFTDSLALLRASSYLLQLQQANNLPTERAQPFSSSIDDPDQRPLIDELEYNDGPSRISPDMNYLADLEDALESAGSGQFMAIDSDPLAETAIPSVHQGPGGCDGKAESFKSPCGILVTVVHSCS